MSSPARVLVAGSINMDVVVRVERPPSPGETLTGHDLEFHPGGKGANQAIAAAGTAATASDTPVRNISSNGRPDSQPTTATNAADTQADAQA